MKNTSRKVAIIGSGFVGTSIAYSIINQGIADELVLVDINRAKAEGEVIDLKDGTSWGRDRIKVKLGDYSDCGNADLIILTAGLNQKPGQTRLELVGANAKITRGIVEEVMKSGFDGIFLVASNPVDVLTQVVWESSKLPAHRVIGTGTTLDTARFKKELALKLEVDPRSVHGYIIGEHGDSEVAVWSHTSIGGKSVAELVMENKRLKAGDLQVISEKVKNTAYEIINRKKATYYGIGMSTARIVRALLNDEQAILPVSAHLDGEYGQKDIFTGVPAILDQKGVREIIQLQLTDDEQKAFEKSVSQLRAVLEEVK